jgi:hypothetical protein
MKTESSRIIESELRGNAGTWDDSADGRAQSSLIQLVTLPIELLVRTGTRERRLRWQNS